MALPALNPATTYPAVIGRVLALSRESRGLDQAAVAMAVGVSQPTWSRIESGSLPLSVDQLVRVSEVLGLAPSEILRKAEAATNMLKKRGIHINQNRIMRNDEPDPGLVLIGIAALGALIALGLKLK